MPDNNWIWREKLVGEYRDIYRQLGKMAEIMVNAEEEGVDVEYIGSMRRDVAWVIGRLRLEERPVGDEELAVLSQRQRAVYLARQGGLTYGQIAQLLKLSRGAVEHHLMRARQKPRALRQTEG